MRSDLPAAAARRLISHTGVDLSTIDALIFTSQTPDYRIPATASRLHGELGLGEHCYVRHQPGLCLVYFLVAGGPLLVVAQTAPRAVAQRRRSYLADQPKDPGLVALHGDAAAAILVEPSDRESGGVEFFETGTSGKDYEKLIVPPAARMPSTSETRRENADGSGACDLKTSSHGRTGHLSLCTV